MSRFLWICLGGALGSGARYLTWLGAVAMFGTAFPFGDLGESSDDGNARRRRLESAHGLWWFEIARLGARRRRAGK